MTEVKNFLAFSEELGKLKHIERQGWVQRGLHAPERVAVGVGSPLTTLVSLFLI